MIVTKTEKTVRRVEITVPAGTYTVGDPCYSVPNEVWMEWLVAADFENQREILFADIDGKTCVGVNTAYGDGVYSDQFGNEYPVDAGLIGVVPVEFGTHYPKSVVVHTFDKPVTCYRDDNDVIHLGHIRIETGDDE